MSHFEVSVGIKMLFSFLCVCVRALLTQVGESEVAS